MPPTYPPPPSGILKNNYKNNPILMLENYWPLTFLIKKRKYKKGFMKYFKFKNVFTFKVLLIILSVVFLFIGGFLGLLIGVRVMTGSILGVASSLIIAVAAVVSAILTGFLVYNNIQLREEQYRPRLFISYEALGLNRAILSLIVENRGIGAAYDVRFKVDPDIECYGVGHKKISEHPFIKSGISYISPGQQMKDHLTVLNIADKEKYSIKPFITIEYKNVEDKPYKDKFTIDFSYML